MKTECCDVAGQITEQLAREPYATARLFLHRDSVVQLVGHFPHSPGAMCLFTKNKCARRTHGRKRLTRSTSIGCPLERTANTSQDDDDGLQRLQPTTLHHTKHSSLQLEWESVVHFTILDVWLVPTRRHSETASMQRYSRYSDVYLYPEVDPAIEMLTRMWANVQLGSRPRGAVPTVAISSSDKVTRKTHGTPRIKHRVASCYTAKLYRFERLLASPHAPREQSITAVGGGTPTVFGMDVLA